MDDMTTTKLAPPRDRRSQATLGRLAALRPNRPGGASLVDGRGEAIVLPREMLGLLSTVAGELQAGRTVLVVTGDAELTPREAAGHLGMSRQFLMRLLDQGALPFHRVGSHRRLLLQDVLRFAERRAEARREALEKLRDKIQSEGLDA